MNLSDRTFSTARRVTPVRGRAIGPRWSEELSPAQHRLIRGQLALLPVYAWAIYSWLNFFAHLPAGTEPVRDFMHFYTQGAIANLRDARALYDMDAQSALLESLVAGANGVRYPPVYGPQVAVFFSPFARFPYGVALDLWLGFTVLAYGVCAWWLWRVSAALRAQKWIVAVLFVAAPALRVDLGSGQAAAIGLVCVTLGFLAFRAERPLLAGLAIGALIYKPQLGLAAAFVFLFAREWRVVIGAAVSATAQIAVGCLFWGTQILGPYIRALKQLPTVAADMEPLKHHMHSWRSFFELLALPPEIAVGCYVLAATITLVTALACWQSKGPLGARYAALILATVLVDPHLYAYDLLIVVPALVLLWNWVAEDADRPLDELCPSLANTPIGRWSFQAFFLTLLYLTYFSAVFGELAATVRIQPSVLMHGLVLGIVAYRCLNQPTRQAVPAARWCPSAQVRTT